MAGPACRFLPVNTLVRTCTPRCPVASEGRRSSFPLTEAGGAAEMPGVMRGRPRSPVGVSTLVCANAADEEIMAPTITTHGKNRFILDLPFSSCGADRDGRDLPL